MSRRDGSRPSILLGLVIAATLAACSSGSTGGTSASPAADPTKDKLAQVQARGTLVLFTDPAYPPQSMKVDGAVRAANTKCGPNQLTSPEMDGYDVQTGKLVAAKLGVEPCFVAVPFDEVIAGGWGDRFDVAWGSGAMTTSRMEKLYVTQPYYTTPANFFVKKDSPYQTPADLSGKQIGACSGCTHEQYLRKTLALPGETLTYAVTDPKIVTYASEPPGLDAVAAGKIDAFLCSQPVGAEAITKGGDLRMLDTPAFYTYKTGYIDRSMTLAPQAFLAAIDGAIRDLEKSGDLKTASQKYFGTDYVTAAAAFDMAKVNQTVP